MEEKELKAWVRSRFSMGDLRPRLVFFVVYFAAKMSISFLQVSDNLHALLGMSEANLAAFVIAQGASRSPVLLQIDIAS